MREPYDLWVRSEGGHAAAEFIGLVGSAAALPVLARAQQSMPVIDVAVAKLVSAPFNALV